jgi:hypothetical protein
MTSNATQVVDGYIQSSTTDRAALRRVKGGTAAGQFIEWYDYGIYGFLTIPISKNFFAGGDSTTALLGTFAVFAVTFVFRPFGGVVCGLFADRYGRRKVLVGALLAMSVATTLIGVLPSVATIGVAAPILLTAMRIVQGFSAGGELGSVMSFAGEHAPANQRAHVVSFAQIGSFSSLLLGSLLGLFLTEVMSPEALKSWGWRLPFLFALPLGLIGLWIRRKVEESPAFTELREADEIPAQPLRDALRDRGHPGRACRAVPDQNPGHRVLRRLQPLDRDLRRGGPAVPHLHDQRVGGPPVPGVLHHRHRGRHRNRSAHNPGDRRPATSTLTGPSPFPRIVGRLATASAQLAETVEILGLDPGLHALLATPHVLSRYRCRSGVMTERSRYSRDTASSTISPVARQKAGSGSTRTSRWAR